MKNRFNLMLAALVAPVFLQAAELKVDLNPSDPRKDLLTPHWENWAWQAGGSGDKTFGDVTVTFRAVSTNGGDIATALFKGGLDYGAHMVVDGILTKAGSGAGMDMIISGLAPGRHAIATYHNEIRDLSPTSIAIAIGGDATPQTVMPSKRVTNDYDAASFFAEFEAKSGRDVVIHFRPATNGSVIINGFEIDAGNPQTKAIKPSPSNGDEHVDADDGLAMLSWTVPAGVVWHDIYFGLDADKVAQADRKSSFYQGSQKDVGWRATKLDPAKTYYWRVDEVDASGKTTQGEVWSFRPRQLAFPTAEGYGRFARGGRGGRVIEVTNLEDYDSAKGEGVIPGSFRAAVEADGPRTIVFRVSGLIKLKRPCAVTKPYCTIAGQTAPGDGICLANYSSGAYGTHDVIIRFMRFRIGDAIKKASDGAGLGSCDHAIMDHCSISWSSDEGTSSRGAKNITFQRNIVAEALQHSYHYRASDRTKYETHAFAGSISGNIGSYHHNLLAHCTDRNWSLAGGLTQGGQYAGYLDIRNNVVYNWTARTTDGGVKQLNYVNNYYKPHPPNPFVKWLLKLDPINPAWGTEQYYMTGNVLEGFVDETNNWSAFYNGMKVEAEVRVDHELFPSYVKTQTAREAFTNVLADVGATYPKQDVIDRRLIEETRTGTTHYTGTKGPTYGDRPGPNFAGIIDEPTDVKDAADSPDFPWPEYKTYNVPVDSDHDGIPDDWEKAHGLNPNDPLDANGDYNGDGYTNLEKYLNWLVGEYPMADKAR